VYVISDNYISISIFVVTNVDARFSGNVFRSVCDSSKRRSYLGHFPLDHCHSMVYTMPVTDSCCCKETEIPTRSSRKVKIIESISFKTLNSRRRTQ
jgi:hypothetical protein